MLPERKLLQDSSRKVVSKADRFARSAHFSSRSEPPFSFRAVSVLARVTAVRKEAPTAHSPKCIEIATCISARALPTYCPEIGAAPCESADAATGTCVVETATPRDGS